MSLPHTELVWKHSQHSGSELLLLLALADHANVGGNNIYPSVGALAKKCRMTSRNVNHILATLQASGELEIKRNDGPHGTNRYLLRIDPTGPLKRASPLKPASAPEAPFTPEADFTLKPASCTPEAGFPQPLKPASAESSLNHQEASKPARSMKTPRTNKTKLPANFCISERVRVWAEKKGFDRLDEYLEAFMLKAEAKGYDYENWDTALMTAIREDWAGLRGGRTSVAPTRHSALHADDMIGAAP